MSDEDSPDRRKHGYSELEKKLEEHQIEMEKRLNAFFKLITSRLRRFFLKALFAFAVLGLTSAGGLLGFGAVLKEQSMVDKKIQNQRYRTVFQNCVGQNERHNKTIARAKALPSIRSQETVQLLVNELQPFVADCVKFTRIRVQGTG